MGRGASFVIAAACVVACGLAIAATVGSTARAAAAAPGYIPREIIVRFKPGASPSARAAAIARQKAVVERHLRVPGATLVTLQAGASVADAVRDFAARPDVLFAQPNFVYHAQALPSDSLFGLLWGLNNTGQSVGSLAGAADADIDAPEAWDLTTGSSSVRVAVVDTGVEYEHPDLAANVTRLGHDFYSGDYDPRDENGHGTHVAGTIGARSNGLGVVGVSWQVDLLPVRALGPTGSGTSESIANALIYAAQNGARVVNASLGGSSYDPTLEASVANAPGTLFVVAAGNGGQDRLGDNNDLAPVYPCNLPEANLICVAATDPTDSLATFSNYGPSSVDIAAPGVQVTSTWVGGIYAASSGTSMATPHVAGVAALMLARNPAASVAQLRATLLGSVDVLPSLEGKIASGRVNAYKAVAAIAPAPPPPRASPPPAAPPPAPAVRRPLKKVVKKRVMCLRRRTIKVPGTQVAKYKKKGAKLGACKPKKKKHP